MADSAGDAGLITWRVWFKDNRGVHSVLVKTRYTPEQLEDLYDDDPAFVAVTSPLEMPNDEPDGA